MQMFNIFKRIIMFELLEVTPVSCQLSSNEYINQSGLLY